ncbi:unnamed protein product, partial [Urochloa humidicola]
GERRAAGRAVRRRGAWAYLAARRGTEDLRARAQQWPADQEAEARRPAGRSGGRRTRRRRRVGSGTGELGSGLHSVNARDLTPASSRAGFTVRARGIRRRRARGPPGAGARGPPLASAGTVAAAGDFFCDFV